MVVWLHPSIADHLQVVNRGLPSTRTFIRSISDCRGRPNLERSSSDVLPSPTVLHQSRRVRYITAPSQSAARIWRAAALALFPNWNSYNTQWQIRKEISGIFSCSM